MSMKKRYLLLIFISVISFSVYSQTEIIEKAYCSELKLEKFLETNTELASEVYPDEGYVDKLSASVAGWNGMRTAFGLTGMPLGLVGEIFDPTALKTINPVAGKIGEGLVFLQLSIDFYNGDYDKGVKKFAKSGIYWAVDKFGWKSLRIASIGVQMIDYSLHQLAAQAIKARTDAWGEAYLSYYTKEGYVKLEDWKNKFLEAESKEEIEKIIDAHLQKFWNYGFRFEYVTQRTVLGNIPTEPHLKEERKQIEDTYKYIHLLPRLKALFLRMPNIQKQNKINEICAEFDKLRKWLNGKNRVYVRPASLNEIPKDCEILLQYTIDGITKDFMIEKGDANASAFFRYTRNSLLVHKIKEANVLVRVTTPNGVKTFNHKVDLAQKDTTIIYKYKYELEIDSLELFRVDSLRRDSLLKDSLNLKNKLLQRGLFLRDSIKNDSIAKINVVKDTIDAEESLEEIFGLNEEVEVPSFNFKDRMDAVFTIMKSPLKVKVNKIKETATHYHGLIISSVFFKENELILNKVTGELSITYKLKGKRAPWLICKSATPVLGVYTGRIITNNKHAVDVGYFSFKFKD